MRNKTLVQLYTEHIGKVSDKWSSYLIEYERILDEYRDRAISLLEIGIQNGGSLEVWSKYFPQAQKLVGCDINPDCGRLSYDDPRIAVVVGDANSDTAQATVLGYAPALDVVIDDGSHRSNDIVKSFARYFPHLTDGGVYVAEDLHCSYWQEFEGGLFDPFSSISFFKGLADVVNHEHWGIDKASAEIFSGFCERYGSPLDEEALQHIHSVEFINSMCVIRKNKPARNKLGARIIAGSVEEIEAPGHFRAPDQSRNKWTARSMPPNEELLLRMKELADRDGQISNLNQAVGERDGQISNLNQAVGERDGRITSLNQAVGERDGRIASLNQAVGERDGRIASLNQAVGERDGRIASLNQVITERDGRIANLDRAVLAYQSSTSWRVTLPLRMIAHQTRHVARAILPGILLSKLNHLRTGPSHWLRGFVRGETKESRELAPDWLRVCIDESRIGLVNIVDDSWVVSGWAVDLKARSAAKVRIIVGTTEHRPYAKRREDVQRVFGDVCELPLDTGFTAVIALPVGVHRVRIEVGGVDGSWICVRRTLLLRRPRIRRIRSEDRLSYSAWTRLEQKRLKVEIPDIKRHINVMLHKPVFTVVVDTRSGIVGLEGTIQSIRKQLYPCCDVRVLTAEGTRAVSSLPDDVKTLKDMSLSDIRGDFIVFLQSGQRLAINTLYEFAAAINQYPDVDLVYGDEDFCTASGSRFDPFCKPAWSPDYLETFDYLGFPTCFRTAIGVGCFDKAHLYDFVLRFTERTARVLHVSKILGHSVQRHGVEEAASANADALDNIAALQGRLNRTGRRGVVREHELHKGCYEIQLDLKRSPLVSVVIPTAGKTITMGERQIDLIENVISQIRGRSTYKNIEIIVVDNGDLSHAQMNALAEARCRRITYREVFNISKKLNLGVSIARGELLLLMNDDIEILTPSWIERLLEHFEKPHVGVVGAKLLYPNLQTQHVGVVLNFGNPDHVRRFFPRNDAGYFFSTCGVRNYSAVTGACMMTPTSIYRAVGGFSEELAVSLSDVDYCHKVRRKGLWAVYVPSAELIHMESASRVPSLDTSELAWYYKQWAADTVSDQFYNELFLTVAPPTYMQCINQRLL